MYPLQFALRTITWIAKHNPRAYTVLTPEEEVAIQALADDFFAEVGNFLGPNLTPECVKHYQPSLKAFQKAVDASKVLAVDAYLVVSLQNLALVCFHVGQYKEAVDLLSDAIVLYGNNGNQYELAKALWFSGMAQYL